MASVTTRKKAWVLSYRQNGRLIQRTIGQTGTMSKREAELICKTKELELATGKSILLDKSKAALFTTLASKYLIWHADQYPDSHFRIKQIIDQHLLKAFKHTHLKNIDEPAVSAYKRGRKVKQATVTKELRTLKAMLNKAVEWEMIDANPLRYVKEPKPTDSKPPEFYTVDQLKGLYSKSGAYAPVWKLMANTGLRRGEVQHLQWDHIEGTQMKVLSESEARTKSGKWRAITLNKSAEASLEELKNDSAYVLPRMTPSSLSRAAIRCAKRAGLKGSIHTLRHTFISHLVMLGVPLRTVQVLAGHSTIAVTEGYAHLAPSHMQDVMKGFEI